MTKGLLISIFKNPMYAKCSNGGISETNDRALVIGPGIPEIFEAGELPVLKLESHYRGIARLVPIDKPSGRAGPSGTPQTAGSRKRSSCSRVLRTSTARCQSTTGLNRRNP